MPARTACVTKENEGKPVTSNSGGVLGVRSKELGQAEEAPETLSLCNLLRRFES